METVYRMVTKWRCMSQTGYINVSNVWNCMAFDPLNSSDGQIDSDRCRDLTLGCGDGFDVDRDGTIEPHEFYTNAEEYLYGAPENWMTEFDGLRCSGEIAHLVDPCKTEETRPTVMMAGWERIHSTTTLITIAGWATPDRH